MGQQQTATVGGSAALRRMVLALLVAALMAATMAVGADPAMAENTIQSGVDQPPGPPSISNGPDQKNGKFLPTPIVNHDTGSGAAPCVLHGGKNGGKLTGGGC